ncbi:MAG: hypothetical protein II938_03860 [Alphaproteobacteria bacterium]|nr:hypothetical protein [Alphaproteobacteria bacterium]
MMSFSFSLSQFFLGLAMGSLICLVYLTLLWLSLKALPKIKHKVPFLLITAIIRISLAVVLLFLCAQHNLVQFLSILCGFILTRLILLNYLPRKAIA